VDEQQTERRWRGWVNRIQAFLLNHGLAAPKGLGPADEFDAILPIVRTFCLITGVYYAIVVFNRFQTETGTDLAILLALAIINSAASFFFYFRYLRNTKSLLRLDIASSTVNALLLINPITYQFLHYDPQRLIYFAFLALIFGATSVRLRVMLPSFMATLAALIGFAVAKGTIAGKDSAVLAILIVPVVMMISLVVRNTLFQAIRARITAERLHAEASAMANCDALTGLPNRRSFFRQIEACRETSFDLALIDLDGFKPVNDIYGHSVGDELLIAVARRLSGHYGAEGFAARIGGDEFAIILHGARSEQQLQAFGTALCDVLRETYLLGSVAANISASVGFVRAAGTGLTASQLLERADYALYFAKQNLRGAPVVFTQAHEAEMHDFSVVDQTLRAADLDGELSIVFQPQVDAVERRTTGFEALARWTSPHLGDVRPDVFIKAAERSGLITRVTLVLLEKALAQVSAWPPHLRVSFNLSARDLRSSLSINNIREAVKRSGVDPCRIEFEITETAMLTDFEQACEALLQLKGMGCRVAIDDFGSGYSSFSYIHRLPVDKIKIDRSFVTQLVKHDAALKIIKTIIDLCRNLHLDCVVEGVETERELSQQLQVKARHIQGFLFSRPMPAGQIDAYLVKEKTRPARLAEGLQTETARTQVRAAG
jgi:diguanylate cyclase (GGDEF)-like protein